MGLKLKVDYQEVIVKAEAHARCSIPTTAPVGKEGKVYLSILEARIESYIAGVAEVLDDRMLVLEHRLSIIRAKQVTV